MPEGGFHSAALAVVAAAVAVGVAVAVAVAVADAVAVAVAVGVAVGALDSLKLGAAVALELGVASTPESQVLPLSLKEVGTEVAPEREAMKPVLTVPPVASEPLPLMLFTLTVVPDWLQVPSQPSVTFSPPVSLKVSRHLVSGLPELEILTAPWKPSSHWLVML
jgi:hypothetical protein